MTARSNQSKAVTIKLPLDLPNDSRMKDPASADNRSQPVHRWVPWVAGFSGQFVSDIFARFMRNNGNHRPLVLDPFCGVGTTLVEGLRHGFDSVGFEINPYAALASHVKTTAVDLDLPALARLIGAYRECMTGLGMEPTTADSIHSTKPKSQPPPKFKSRIPFFSDSILRQVLVTQDFISDIADEALQKTFLIAFGAVMVGFSNYSYEPSLGTRPGSGKPLISDAPVGEIVSSKLDQILEDVSQIQQRQLGFSDSARAFIYEDSFFNAKNYISKSSVDLVVTSPPYLNNYHYVRNTRPQLWWLGLVDDSARLREMEQQSMGKFWQSVRDMNPIALEVPIRNIEVILKEVRDSNTERGSYGGPGWGNYVASYFNDLNKFVGLLAEVLRPEAHAVVVIGNSIIQGVEIPVDRLFSEVAGLHGLATESINVVRAKRVGSSIVDSTVRTQGQRRKITLYDAAVTLSRRGTQD